MKLLLTGLFLLSIAAGCGMDSIPTPRMPSFGSVRHTGYLPEDGFVPGWTQSGKDRSYRGAQLKAYIGNQAVIYQDYGVNMLYVADYKYGEDKTPTLAIEAYLMNSPMAASGIYHYHRGTKLRGEGTPVDVGAEGVRETRVLYFYKGAYFYKVISTAKEAPDLEAIARVIADKIPGEAKPPRGFEFLTVDGVDVKTSRVTQGYLFNYDFLPPAILCAAPGAGPKAEIFLISHYQADQAQKTAEDYRKFLQQSGLDYNLIRSQDHRQSWSAKDPNIGFVYTTQYKQWVVGITNPENAQAAEAILERVLARMRG